MPGITPPPPPTTPTKPRKRGLPILARHAISLGVVFVLALPLSLYLGQAVYRNAQLNKLQATDASVFDQGLTYVYNHAGEDERVRDQALADCLTLPTDRATRLLLAVASAKPDRQPVAEGVYQAMGPMIQEMDIKQALDLYDALQQVPGTDRAKSAKALLHHLRPTTDADLLYAVHLLDQQYLWSKDDVPRELWLRWLAVRSGSPDKLTQLQAARLLSELPDDLEDGRIAEAFDRLSASAHPEVRAQALTAAAGYARIAKDPTDYEQIIFKLGGDENKIIARRAWLIVGHLNPLSGYAVNWKDTDPFVAEAMLWASVKTNPNEIISALLAFKTPGYEAVGALALSEWHRPIIHVTKVDLVIQRLLQADHDVPFKVKLRSILASQEYKNAEASAINKYAYQVAPNEHELPLYLAGQWVRGGFAPKPDPDNPFYNLELLAYLEGLLDHGDALDPFVIKMLEISPDWLAGARILASMLKPESDASIRLSIVADADNPTRDLLIAAATVNQPWRERYLSGVRSRDRTDYIGAAILAGIMDEHPKLIAVYADFLRKHPDLTDDQLHAMSDAELAEFGLKRVDALTALLEAAEAAPASANRQSEVKLLKLALWMRGDLGDDFTPSAEAMLFDNDLPTSTVLMCLLHMQRPVALDYVFGDLVTPRPDLHELFISERWWHVFRRFVDTSDLTLWLWGDPEAQAFQIEAMRQWYAVNRWRIERGWWPSPGTK